MSSGEVDLLDEILTGFLRSLSNSLKKKTSNLITKKLEALLTKSMYKHIILSYCI